MVGTETTIICVPNPIEGIEAIVTVIPIGPQGPPGPIGPLGSLDQATADGLYVNITGDTMTGTLGVVEPVNGNHAASKQYVDQAIALGKDQAVVISNQYADQEITVSNVDPVGVPSRDGLLWYVI